MKYFLFLLCMGIQIVSAQHNIIDLSRSTLKNMPEGYFIESVIDAREDKSSIGYIFESITTTEKTPAQFKNSPETELKMLFDKSSPADMPKRLILRINKLYVYETLTPDNRNMAITELNISFIEHTNGNYKEIFRARASSTITTLLDVSPGQAENLVQGLDLCLDQFNHRNRSKPALRIEEAALYSNPLKEEETNAAILTTPLQKGVYYAIDDFRDNLADTSMLTKENQVDNAKRALFQKEGKDIWGYSDGSKAYIRIGQQYIPITIQNALCTFIADYKEMNNASYAMSAATGGLLGILVFTAEENSNDTIAYIIDFSSGKAVPYKDKAGNFVGNRLLLYATEFSLEDKAVEISVDDKKVCTLRKNTFYILRTPAYVNQVHVCFTMDGAKTCETLFSSVISKELYECGVKKKNAFTLKYTPSGSTAKEVFGNINAGVLTKICD